MSSLVWIVFLVFACFGAAIGVVIAALKSIYGVRFDAMSDDKQLVCAAIQYLTKQQTVPRLDSFATTVKEVRDLGCIGSQKFILNGKTFDLRVQEVIE